MRCEEAEKLLAAYALDALGDDAEALEEHLEGCPTCRLALEQHQQIVLHLPQTVNQVDPPADLKGRLMARIDALEGRSRAEQAKPARTHRSRRRWFGIPAPRKVQVMIGSLAGVSLFLVGWTVFQTMQVNDLRDANVELASDIRKQWDTLAFATAPGVETVPLTGTEMSPATKGNLLVNAQENKAILMVTGLTPPDKDMVYQLWLWKHDNTRTSLGTFRTVRRGYVMWPFQSPISLVAYRYWGVTMEPRGGSERPTGDLILGSQTNGQ
ncbi:MAG: anti-sigma factor [Dehalococcoidia bacterium]